jgi:hypothetical protein
MGTNIIATIGTTIRTVTATTNMPVSPMTTSTTMGNIGGIITTTMVAAYL